MFRASSAHLQEDTVVHMQHVVLSLSMRVRGGLSVHSLSERFVVFQSHLSFSVIFLHSLADDIPPILQIMGI